MTSLSSFVDFLRSHKEDIANGIIYGHFVYGFIATGIGQLRLTKVKDTSSINLWLWSFDTLIARTLYIYACILLQQPTWVTIQLLNIPQTLSFGAIVVYKRIKYNDPVGLPVFLVLTLLKRIRKERARKHKLARYRTQVKT